MKLIIAEKPSVGRDIGRVLRATQRGDGYISGNGYIVTWAIGHLVHFAEPNDYGRGWDGRWSFNQLPIVPDEWKTKTHKDTVSQFNTVRNLMHDPNVEEIICATDAGREGEHIFRLIYQHAQCSKPFKRLWISSLTDEAIQKGFSELHQGEAFDDLAHAARCRAQADWLVGMNLTRAYTVHHGALYTIGRVQTPTLGMIVKREITITKFTKAFYYEIQAHLEEGFEAKWTGPDGKTRIDEKPRAERLHKELEPHKTGKVTDVKKKKKRHRPPQLYDLITLQKDANKRFGLTAAEVLKLAQQLYEQFKVITYPRTESRHISEDMVPQLPGILANLDHPQAPLALERLRGGHKLSKHYVDRTKLSDHHGILPTNRRAPASLSGQLRNIYELIVTRFVCIFLPDQVVEETKVTLDIGGQVFTSTGSVVLEEGWKIADPPRKKEKRQKIPPLEKGQEVHVKKLDLLEKETEPPKRYTDATLLTAMKNAGREVEDDELAEAMKESGLGTPATRAEMIEKLIRTRYIERRKKILHPTEKGMALISVVTDSLRSAELTGSWEQQLKDIENGERGASEYYEAIVNFVKETIPLVQRVPRLRISDPRPGDKRPPPKAPAKGGMKQNAPSKQAAPEKKGKIDPRHIGPCPACDQGTILKGNKAYGCSQFRQGCRFLVPIEYKGKALSPKQIHDLLIKGKTSKLIGFKGETGEVCSGKLHLKDGRIEFEALKNRTSASNPKKPEEVTCPQCGKGRIIKGKTAYGCNRFREGCRFMVRFEIAGKKLSESQTRDLLFKGRTRKLKGFKNKEGNKFDARLKLEQGQVKFDFD